MKALEMASVVLWLVACDESSPPGPPEDEAPPSDSGPAIPVEVSWNGISPSVRSTPPLPPRVGTAEVTYIMPEGTRGLSDVTAVEVRLRVSGLVGSASVDAEFLAPGPAVYEKHSRTVETTPTEARELVFSLPVAGTNIPLHGLSGRWEARFFVDGSPLTTTTFTLER